ncbi:MAG: hypothetical protein KJP18_13895, partial [Gemmatimonadetes bacterium]|nr:hypothetical protein [Gemmatimonadota bacterium]
DRSLHHPDAWVAIAAGSSEGPARVRVTDLAGYHGDNAPRAQPTPTPSAEALPARYDRPADARCV